MTETVAVFGANGVYGRHLVPRLLAAGFSVRAIVRRPEVAEALRLAGTEIGVADIFDPEALERALKGCDSCVNLATSLPGPSGRGDFDTNDRVRREGVPLLIEACARAGVGRLVQQSISWVGAAGETLADESSVFEPPGDNVGSRAICTAQDMERSVQGSGLDWLILRGGLFYGPGTGFDEDWLARAKAGTLRLPGDGADFVSLIHIADMAVATVLALANWPSRQTLIVADDRPARWREVFAHVAAIAGGAQPEPGGRAGFPSFRMSNLRAKEVLGWAPAYPDYRAGLAR
ncbi:MAG: NAD-dependent epimerase/dehydratase family protein [Rhizobiaceae bacterium]